MKPQLFMTWSRLSVWVSEYTHLHTPPTPSHTDTHAQSEREGVLLTLQLGSSQPEQHNCWECNQFHLW